MAPTTQSESTEPSQLGSGRNPFMVLPSLKSGPPKESQTTPDILQEAISPWEIWYLQVTLHDSGITSPKCMDQSLIIYILKYNSSPSSQGLCPLHQGSH